MPAKIPCWGFELRQYIFQLVTCYTALLLSVNVAIQSHTHTLKLIHGAVNAQQLANEQTKQRENSPIAQPQPQNAHCSPLLPWPLSTSQQPVP